MTSNPWSVGSAPSSASRAVKATIGMVTVIELTVPVLFARLVLPQQVRQLGDIGRYASCFVACEQFSR